jgi:arsenate reductase (glutaredoxin)
MSTITIYHNPRCSKSRATLDLVEQRGGDFKVIEYLETPPTAKELEALLAKLGLEPEQLVRKGEEIYKTQYAGKKLTRAQWIEAMVRHPILIERPIIVLGDRAVIGRPPENVRALFEPS